MTKAMISQPMAGETDEQIAATREKATASLEAMGYEVVNTLFTDEWYSDEAMRERVEADIMARASADCAAARPSRG